MLAESAAGGPPEDARGAKPGGAHARHRRGAGGQPAQPPGLLLGGYFAPLTRWLREPIEAELHRRLLAGDGSGCQVLAARLGGEAAVRGAAALARRTVLADPLGHAPLPQPAAL